MDAMQGDDWSLRKDIYLSSTRGDASWMLVAAREGLEAPVPSCPGWTVADVVAHCGGFLGWMGDIVQSRSQEPLAPDPERHGLDRDDPDLLAHTETRLDEYEATMREVDPGERVWTWWPPDQTAGFWMRRAAQEMAIHRWDAQLAHQRTEPLDPTLARDGIDEMFDVMLPASRSWSKQAASGETYHFHQTDGDGEWLVRLQGNDVAVSREHAKGDVAVRGTASDLLLFLWHRILADRLEVHGDAALLDRYFELAIPPE